MLLVGLVSKVLDSGDHDQAIGELRAVGAAKVVGREAGSCGFQQAGSDSILIVDDPRGELTQGEVAE